MLNEVIQETKERMIKSLNAFEKEMIKVRTGRASTTLLDGVKVDYYGAETPLDQMAS
ncbi:MAG: ribosome recycling factor, partial [Desulfobacteraceae bacterium]|nr:ribosome recycling factor [Desulfobacteraceae bacterium]